MVNSSTSEAGGRPIAQSVREYGRGIAGGLLFSLPLLFTMEMWQSGFVLLPARLLIGLTTTFLLLLGYNRYAGMRADASFWEVAIDSVEELGIGLVIAALLLWLLGQIHGDMPLSEVLGKITIEGLTIAIGVSVGTAQLGSDDEDSGIGGNRNTRQSLASATMGNSPQQFGGQIVIALCGAVLFAANVAPTEEIIQIAFEATPAKLLGLALVSIALCAVVLQFSSFYRPRQLFSGTGWQAAVQGIVVTYAIALLVSAALLWFFGRFQGLGWSAAIGAVIVLGSAAALGSSAGRLLLQVGNQ